MEVKLVYSEPKAVVHAGADSVMQTAKPGSADHQCSICMEGFESVGAGPMASVNLPCSHPFHAQCITVWLFKRHSCTVWRCAAMASEALSPRPGRPRRTSMDMVRRT